ncbi:MAG: ABC transporter permease [Nitriliruptoraceae bacterium]|nr:ABC transporter permease [Nitriliruptoraceae bacterium]
MTRTVHTDRAPDAAIPLGERVFWQVRDTWTVTRRNLRHFVRQPRLLVFSTIQPVMFVVLFSYVFGGVAGVALPDGLEYIDFLLPGIFVQSAAFRSTQTAVGLAEDLERGVVDRFRSMPMSRSAVLAGRTFADLIRSLAVILLMIAVGMAIGFRFTQGLLAAIGAVLIVGLFSLLMSWLFCYLALLVPGAEAAQTAGFVVIFPLVFASSIFVPLETMPGWLASIAAQSPLTHTADTARALSIGGPVLEPLLWTVLWCGGLLAIVVPLAVRRYRAMT